MQMGKVLPDELEHQQLVEIGIEQRSRDRIEPPVVVVRSPGKIDNHDAFTLSDDAAAPPWTVVLELAPIADGLCRQR